MTQQRSAPADNSHLFANATVPDMYKLSPGDFEGFVGYVFERAGYQVRRTPRGARFGVDLKLYNADDKKPVASVDVRRYAQSNHVGMRAVLRLKTALIFRRTPGYLVTTSDFTGSAYRSADSWRRISLVNGDRFTRYIHYVLGSRYNHMASGPIPLDIVYQADSLKFQPTDRTKVLVIANNKGGVGKTTTALYMATEMARAGQRVLLVDLDAQANLTGLTLHKSARDLAGGHLGEYFAQRTDLVKFVRKTPSPHVDLLPAHPDLRLTDLGGAAHPGIEMQFAEDIHKETLVRPTGAHLPYDWILVDTPPALTLHTRAALAAAHYVLVPAVADRFGLDGLLNMLGTLDAIQGLRGYTIKLLGCVITRWQSNNSSYQQTYFNRFQEQFEARNSRVLQTTIPEDRTLVRTADEEGILGSHARPGAGATAYHSLVEEVLAHADNR